MGKKGPELEVLSGKENRVGAEWTQIWVWFKEILTDRQTDSWVEEPSISNSFAPVFHFKKIWKKIDYFIRVKIMADYKIHIWNSLLLIDGKMRQKQVVY